MTGVQTCAILIFLIEKKIIREIENLTAMNVLSMEIMVKGVNYNKDNKNSK